MVISRVLIGHNNSISVDVIVDLLRLQHSRRDLGPLLFQYIVGKQIVVEQ